MICVQTVGKNNDIQKKNVVKQISEYKDKVMCFKK